MQDSLFFCSQYNSRQVFMKSPIVEECAMSCYLNLNKTLDPGKVSGLSGGLPSHITSSCCRLCCLWCQKKSRAFGHG